MESQWCSTINVKWRIPLLNIRVHLLPAEECEDDKEHCQQHAAEHQQEDQQPVLRLAVHGDTDTGLRSSPTSVSSGGYLQQHCDGVVRDMNDSDSVPSS